MTGNITRRGTASWRIKYEIPAVGGARKTIYVTLRGSRKDAERELRKRLGSIDDGTHVDPSSTTLGDYLASWLAADASLSPKTAERYLQLIDHQIVPHLGKTALQKLRPAEVAEWHSTLLKHGGYGGKPLSPRTVGHAHRVLHRGLSRGVALELIARNVASAVKPPKVEDSEIEILTADQIAAVLAALEGYGGRYGWLPLHTVAVVALGTGARRGELLGLTWDHVNVERGTIRIDRSLEETRAGLRLKQPKTRASRRTVSIGATVVEVLRNHRRRLVEHRLALGMGRLSDDDLVFPNPEGGFLSPDSLSRAWGHAMRDRALPAVSFHSLRHSSASALIGAGFDPVTVSRRLGHANASTTLRVYAHRFSAAADNEAAAALDAALGAKR